MVTREYECEVDGYFQVRRSISDPVQEICPKCGGQTVQAPTKAPTFGIAGVDGGIPNNSSDEAGYEQWQRETWSKWEDKLHVDNAGTKRINPKHLLELTESGKDR